MRVVGDELGGVLIGLGVEKSVEAVEAAPANGPVAPLSVNGVTCHLPTM